MCINQRQEIEKYYTTKVQVVVKPKSINTVNVIKVVAAIVIAIFLQMILGMRCCAREIPSVITGIPGGHLGNHGETLSVRDNQFDADTILVTSRFENAIGSTAAVVKKSEYDSEYNTEAFPPLSTGEYFGRLEYYQDEFITQSVTDGNNGKLSTTYYDGSVVDFVRGTYTSARLGSISFDTKTFKAYKNQICLGENVDDGVDWLIFDNVYALEYYITNGKLSDSILTAYKQYMKYDCGVSSSSEVNQHDYFKYEYYNLFVEICMRLQDDSIIQLVEQ